MKVLLVNGSPAAQDTIDTAFAEVSRILGDHNIETEILRIGDMSLAACISCGKCRKKKQCIYNDVVNEVNEKEYAALLIGSPVYYGGPCPQVTVFLERLLKSGKEKWLRKPASAVFSCRRGGASSASGKLHMYFTMADMTVLTASSWNQFNEQDEAEGMRNMRNLAENMAWILQCLEAGKEKGIPEPVFEKKTEPDYIR